MLKRQSIQFRPRFALTKPVQNKGQAIPTTDNGKAESHTSTLPRLQKSTKPKIHESKRNVRVDFFLPEELVAQIDMVWIELRRFEGRKVTKSEMIRRILEAHFQKSEGGEL